MEHTYPRFALSSCQTNLSIQASSAFTTPEITASSTISEQYSGTSTTGSSCALTNYSNSSTHGTLQHTSSGGPSPSTQCPSNCQSPCASPQTAIKRKRSTNPQADENFIRALDAVRYGGIGFCKAARMYGVNNRTLWLEYKKRGYPNNRPSLKSRVKQEVNSSPPPSAAPPSSAQPINSQSPTPMGPPTTPHSTHNTHSTHTMLTSHSPHTMLSGYIDSRHTDAYTLPSPTMPINLHGVNYNAMWTEPYPESHLYRRIWGVSTSFPFSHLSPQPLKRCKTQPTAIRQSGSEVLEDQTDCRLAFSDILSPSYTYL